MESRPYKKKRKPGECGRLRGYLDALEIIYTLEGFTDAYDCIVDSAGLSEVVAIARRDGRMTETGLSDCVRERAVGHL